VRPHLISFDGNMLLVTFSAWWGIAHQTHGDPLIRAAIVVGWGKLPKAGRCKKKSPHPTLLLAKVGACRQKGAPSWGPKKSPILAQDLTLFFEKNSVTQTFLYMRGAPHTRILIFFWGTLLGHWPNRVPQKPLAHSQQLTKSVQMFTHFG
jgi:hypothetical protein